MRELEVYEIWPVENHKSLRVVNETVLLLSAFIRYR